MSHLHPRRAFLRRTGMATAVVGLALYGPIGRLFGGHALAQTSDASGEGLLVGNVSDVTAAGSLAFTDPATGDPALVVEIGSGTYVSFDAVCTHAGCTVAYDPQQKLLVCPCHGSEYDPANQAAVVAGPAPAPLVEIPIQVDSNGNVYALDAPTPTNTPAPTRTPTATVSPKAHKRKTATPTPKPTPRPARRTRHKVTGSSGTSRRKTKKAVHTHKSGSHKRTKAKHKHIKQHHA